MVNSSYGVLEQIERRFRMDFKINLDNEPESVQLVIIPLGKPFTLNEKKSYKKIRINNKFYSSFDESHKGLKQDFF